MPGGLLNIVSYGNQNIILNGNPSKTFFKAVYAKYTNFGVQKFRVDFQGQRTLKLNEDTIVTFKLPRQADLILDTYLVMNLPDIWSPIIPPEDYMDCWKPYEFKWIENFGFNIIKNMRLTIGGQKIQEFTGEYLKNMVERDYPVDKREMVYKMIGHTVEMYDPANAYNRFNRYPNTFYMPPVVFPYVGPEPSIRGKTLYIPLQFWFMNSPKMALPINCIQYADIQIEITLRPVYEMFKINDVSVLKSDGFIRNPIQPDPRKDLHSLYRFLQIPPSIQLNASDYGNKTNGWNDDLHLLATYAFLTDEENKVFASKEQRYLIKDVKEDVYHDIAGNKRIKLTTNGLVSSWMWFLRRNDVHLRNEWSNYTNWYYNTKIPFDVIEAPVVSSLNINNQLIGPGKDFTTIPDYTSDISGAYQLYSTNYYINPFLNNDNIREIMTSMSIIFDGKYRESNFHSGIYNLIEKYKGSNGHPNDCLYCYNYALTTSPFDLQPSGAINLSKFKTIELEITTILPSLDPSANFSVIYDSECQPIGTVQPTSIYIYNYDLYFIEERYNILRIIGGNAGLLYAR
jgi:hypothetical protein